MQLVVLGLNHKTVSVDIREQFAIPRKVPEVVSAIWMERKALRRRWSFPPATEPKFMQY